MTAAGSTFNDVQESSNNPALNPQAFERAVARQGAEAGRMTARGAYLKTLLFLAVLVAGAAFGWSQVQIIEFGGRTLAIQPAWTWLAILLTLVFGFMGIVGGRSLPVVAALYCLCYGSLLGISARYFNLEFDGVVLQAVLATILVFLATLVLYMTGILKATSRLAMGVAIGLSALLLLYFSAWIFSLFGVHFRFLSQPTTLGIVFSLLVVVLGALNLPLDFEFIKRASEQGAPKFMEWYGAFGLILSIIFMYISILRLLVLLRAGRR